MSDQQFDDLTRRLAGRLSRGNALKAVVAAVAGGVLARFGVGKAQAQFWGNQNTQKVACDQYCDNVFGRGTLAAANCRRDAYNDITNRTTNSLCLGPCGIHGAFNGDLCFEGRQTNERKRCLCGNRTSYMNVVCCGASGDGYCVSGVCIDPDESGGLGAARIHKAGKNKTKTKPKHEH